VSDIAHKRKGAIKFLFWSIVAAVVLVYTIRSYTSGQMARWFYYKAAENGYAVNVDLFHDASKSSPAKLKITTGDTLDGLVAIRVKKGDRLPRNTNGVIGEKVLSKAKRAKVTGDALVVSVPWEIQQSKGFKFKDTFKHKGVETWHWAAVWNVLIVFALGFALGLMAEGFTDMLGLRIQKIKHYTKPEGQHV
jgi:hypothetical protein